MAEAVTKTTVMSKHIFIETLTFKLSSQAFYVFINKYKNHSLVVENNTSLVPP